MTAAAAENTKPTTTIP